MYGDVNPAGTQPNDIIRYTVSWKDDSLNVLASDSMIVNCSTGEIADVPAGVPGKEKEAADPPYTGVKLLSDAEQAPYLAVPNADGATPCGASTSTAGGRSTWAWGTSPAVLPRSR